MANKFFQDMVTVKRAKEARSGKVYKPNIVEESSVQEKKVFVEQPRRREVQEPDELELPKAARALRAEKTTTSEASLSGSNSRSTYVLWGIAVAAVLFLFFAISFLFSKAVVTIDPKTRDVTINENLSASKDSNGDDLSFHLVEITGEESQTLEANGEKEVSERAKGTVSIFNSFSSVSQTLKIDTRLEAMNGKLYKTLTPITVPGMSSGNPGTVDVQIYADQPGESYNSGPMDFTIVGFKGTPKYTKFTVRSKGDITGGQSGKVPAIPDDAKATAMQDLKTNLGTKLTKQVIDQIPEGFILFKDAVFLNTDENNVEFGQVTDNKVTAKLGGTLYGLLIDKNKLIKKIAKDVIPKYDGAPVSIPNIADLTFSLSNKDNVTFTDVTNINFNLSGATKIVWDVDTDKLSADLLGKPKNSFNQILLQYPNIDSANLAVSPFWKMTIPDKLKELHVVVNNPK